MCYRLKLRERETIYDVTLQTTNMAIYEPLHDEYLTDYFNAPSIRALLIYIGMVNEIHVSSYYPVNCLFIHRLTDKGIL